MYYTFRKFIIEDIPRITAFQQEYQKKYPKTVIIPGETYLALSADGNVICALDEKNRMQGYAALVLNKSEAPGAPHIIWAVVRVNPLLEEPLRLQDAIFNQAMDRAKEMVNPYPGHEANLTFQHYAGETDLIRYLELHGCGYAESTYHMMRDLSVEIPVPAKPPAINVGDYRLEDDSAMQNYINIRNESFPDRSIPLETFKLSYRLHYKANGKIIGAFHLDKLVGAVSVYWDENVNKQLGIDMGTTEDVFVRPPWRRKGIAAYLLTLGLQYFKETGRRFAHLEMRANNTGALRLYEKLGYKVAEETRLYTLKLGK